MMLLPIVASADAVEINGVYYNLIGKAGLAEVTNNPNKYTGSIVIPESVVFEGKTYSVTSISNSAFYGCSGLTDVTIGNSVTSIGDNAFTSCRGLTSVTIPNSVTSIGNNTFSGCSGLTSVTIGNSVTSIDNNVFYGCSGLTSVTIGSSVTSIGNNAFEKCGLTSVTIPNSVTSIGDRAFTGCSCLASVTIPNSVKSIGYKAFLSCSGLTSVHVTDIAAWCNIIFDPYASNPLYYAHHLYLNGEEVKDLVIPNNVSSIGNYTFEHCSGFTSLTIPNSVTTIGKEAFYQCSGLTSVTIPNSVTSIGDYAFTGCRGLTFVTIPNSVTSIGYDTFGSCSGLTSVTIPNSVTSIGDYAFVNCSGLISVTIPNSVISIGESAFSGCSGLTSVTIGNSVTTIGNRAFSSCSSLTSMTIGNRVTSIGDRVFSGCSSLTSVHITDIAAWCNINFVNDASNPLYFAHHLYLNGKEVKDLVIPNSVTSIGNLAFFCCSSFTSVTIPNSVTTIGGHAFTNCSGLSSVTIGNSVTSIGNYAFQRCSSLTSVTIGNGVENIGKNAFAGCEELKDVYCLAENVPNTDSYAFEGSYIDYTTLYVPEVSINAYKAAEPWKNFKNIVALEGTYNTFVLSYIVDGEVNNSVGVKEGETITPEPAPTKEGYTFSGWSEIPETMPDHDVTVTGSFTINKYKLTYLVDGEDYISCDVEYNSAITAETAPTKEGYTFSGWSEIPETMPAYDVTVTGSFTINSYKLTYIVDGEEYKSTEVEYNSSITPETDPMKDGYDFSGWSEIPETMPAYDVTITGSFERCYDVGNVTSLISFILRGNGGNDDLAIYDKNGNGVLDIGDLILIVRKVLNNTRRSAITRAGINSLTPDLTQYSAAQFVLNAPESVREQDIRLVGGLENTHQIMCKQIEPGAYAIVIYSLTNSLFTPVDGGIIEVNGGKAHSGDLYIQDVVLAKPMGETKIYDNMPVATKIFDVEKENGHGQVYDLKGQKQNRTDGLQKGVYIENGKKIVVS